MQRFLGRFDSAKNEIFTQVVKSYSWLLFSFVFELNSLNNAANILDFRSLSDR